MLLRFFYKLALTVKKSFCFLQFVGQKTGFTLTSFCFHVCEEICHMVDPQRLKLLRVYHLHHKDLTH